MVTSRARRVWWMALVCGASASAGCGQTVPVGVDDLPAAGGVSGIGGSGGAFGLAGEVAGPAGGSEASSGGEAPCRPTECRGKLYECGDCADNDADGEIDAQDGACLGPCDDDEAGLSTGIVSSGAACRQDCSFDGDAGPGNDGCEWSHQCDPLSVPPSYPPSGEMRCAYEPTSGGVDCQQRSQSQPAACLENCLPLVPNGCDCFGCCELPARSGNFHYVGTGRGACRLEQLDDPQACPPCTPVEGCFNDCAECEACVGSGPESSCEPDRVCQDGQQACGPGVGCSPGFYCVTGCCVRVPVR